MGAQQSSIESAIRYEFRESCVNAILLLLMRPESHLHQGVREISVAPL